MHYHSQSHILPHVRKKGVHTSLLQRKIVRAAGNDTVCFVYACIHEICNDLAAKSANDLAASKKWECFIYRMTLCTCTHAHHDNVCMHDINNNRTCKSIHRRACIHIDAHVYIDTIDEQTHTCQHFLVDSKIVAAEDYTVSRENVTR